MFKKVVLQDGVQLYTRQTNQFKTISMTIKFKSPLDANETAGRTVLANVLQDSNEQYRTQSDFRRALDELYGTSFYTDVGKRGTKHIVSIHTECVNDEYLSENGLFHRVLTFVQQCLFHPNFTADGVFDPEVVRREKRAVKERIRSVYDDKTRYAQKRMLEIMRPDQPASLSAFGTEQAVDAVTPQSLVTTYKHMLANDCIDIYIVGDIDEQEIVEKIQQLFLLQSRPVFAMDDASTTTIVNEEVRTVYEKQEMKQGKLQVGYRTPITFFHPDFYKMQVANGIFGGFAHSKLFLNVREKESMAYYVNSAYAAHYGILYVLAGIDATLDEKAVQLIEEQRKAMQEGDISNKEIEQTIAMLANGIRSAFDSARGQIEMFDQYKELDEHFQADRWIEQWKTVTKKDLVDVAATIELELIYLLSGKEGTTS